MYISRMESLAGMAKDIVTTGSAQCKINNAKASGEKVGGRFGLISETFHRMHIDEQFIEQRPVGCTLFYAARRNCAN